jgi:hypothetical protein
MSIRVLLILLFVTVWLSLTKRYRRVGMPLCAIMIALIIWQTVSEVTEISKPVTVSSASSSSAFVVSLSPSAVQLSDMELTGNGAPWRLRGKLTNSAAVAISAVTVEITRHSCNSVTSEFASCKLVWQGIHTVRIKVPAGASEPFENDIWSHTPVSRQVGVIRDNFQVINSLQSASQN